MLRYDKRTCGQFNDCNDNGYPAPFSQAPAIDQPLLSLSDAVVVQECITHPLICFTPPSSGPLEDEDFGIEVAPKVVDRLTEYMDRVHQNPKD